MLVRPVKALPSRRSRSPSSASVRVVGRSSASRARISAMRAARQAAQIFQRAARLLRVSLPQARQDFGDQPGRKERLVDGVVQVLRQTLAFLQRGQRLGMFIEFGIDHGDRGLVGDGQRQVGMMRGEVIASWFRRYPYRR